MFSESRIALSRLNLRNSRFPKYANADDKLSMSVLFHPKKFLGLICPVLRQKEPRPILSGRPNSRRRTNYAFCQLP